MENTKRSRKRQNLAFAIGLSIGLAAVALLLSPVDESLHAHGPMTPGHETIKCGGCHRPAAGTARQQLQANARYLLGLREQPVDFGYQAVTNERCLGCHERPNDRHPVYRFLEPRFVKAREAIKPQLCTSCHLEHRGRRVSLTDTGYCSNCHKDTKLRKDPLDVSHERLIGLKLWESCLGCHDFHGNHLMKTEKRVEQVIPVEKIRAYFAGAASPYGDVRLHKAKQEIDDEG